MNKTILNSRPHFLWILPKYIFVLVLVLGSIYLYTLNYVEAKYIAAGVMILSGVVFLLISLFYLSLNYRITEDRISFRSGIFNIHTKFTELYRVKDLELLEPFIYRFFGLANIKVYSSDVDLPEFTIFAQRKQLEPVFRKAVEDIRVKKGVREIDAV